MLCLFYGVVHLYLDKIFDRKMGVVLPIEIESKESHRMAISFIGIVYGTAFLCQREISYVQSNANRVVAIRP